MLCEQKISAPYLAATSLIFCWESVAFTGSRWKPPMTIISRLRGVMAASPVKSMGLRPLELHQQAVVAGRVAERLDEVDALGHLVVAADELVLHARPAVAVALAAQVHAVAGRLERRVEAEVGVAHALEQGRLLRLGVLGLVQVDQRLGEELVAAGVVDVQVRAEHVSDVGGLEPQLGQLRGQRLLGRLPGLVAGDVGLHVEQVEAGVVDEEAVFVVDEHRVHREADVAARVRGSSRPCSRRWRASRRPAERHESVSRHPPIPSAAAFVS